MITFKELSWNNCFSYGKDNIIQLDKYELIQIEGKNGSGKSSIPIILEECNYGKNSKGVKKQSIPNRNIKDNSIKMKTIFDKDGIEYIVDLTRKSTISLKLYKDGQDISSHTATATYSTLSEILGIDFKTFSQLIYQSSTSSLQFLTATDTQRKKFLTSLFNLDEYVVMHEVFKDEHRNLVKRVAEIEGSVNTINGWIKTNSRIDTKIGRAHV